MAQGVRVRALHLLENADNPLTGPSVSVGAFCRQMENHLVDARILATSREPHRTVSPTVQMFKRSVGPVRLRFSSQMRKFLMECGRGGHAEILHAHNLWMAPGLYAASARRRSDSLRLLYSPHGALADYSLRSGSRFKPIFWELFQKAALRASDCIHVTSEGELQDIRRAGLRQPAALIPNEVEFCPAGFRALQPERRLVFLGRLHPEKGLEALLRAWSGVGSRCGWVLDIIGPDSSGYLAHLKRIVEEKGIQDVHFSGPVVGDDKWRVLARSGALVLPSPAENFGNVVAEALSSGLPAVTTTGTPWSQLETCGLGWYREPTVDGLTSAIEQLVSMSDCDLYSMRSRCIAWALETLRPGARAKEMADVYRWVLGITERPECVVEQ